ncbi:HU family DNA-binding protein [bacterium]|nr:HU family DNA-binding protein [candidate division CSSED10-310 bacterium]
MTKKELITTIAEDANISKTAAEKALNAVIEGITDALSNREKVTFVGFGTFHVSDRPARKGRNPKTGEPISIPACAVPKFKPGKSLKEAVA